VFAAITLFGLTGALFAGNDSNSTYLALGDSVAFGLNPTLLVLPPPSPSVFIGYPEIVDGVLGIFGSLKEINASCPGETSSSFTTAGAPDFGCHSMGPQGQPPYKTSFGLHVSYPNQTQLEFAVSTLSATKNVKLVTLGIGSNDFFLMMRDCAGDQTCIATHVPGVLQTAAANLAQILYAIRHTAHYNGQLVLVGYYAPSADLIPLAQAFNSTMVAVGAPFGTLYADGFNAFQFAAKPFGGDVCKAGLLIRLSATTCDIHPSPKGRDILAATVLAATFNIH